MTIFKDIGNFVEDYTLFGTVERVITGNKKTSKNPILKPIEAVAKEIDPLTISKDGVQIKQPQLFQDVKVVIQDVERDVRLIGDEMVKAEKFVASGVSYAFKEGKEILVDTKIVVSSLFNIFEKVAIPMIEWMAENPKIIIGGTAVYSGLLVYNQAKMALN